jgi:hypothetical protein
MVDRGAFGDIGRHIGLPLELVTYCLLNQRRPKIVPCATWLYCAWQVPVCSRVQDPSPDQLSFRMHEIKVCLGPTAIVTVHRPSCRFQPLLDTLLQDAPALVRESPATLLVSLAVRASDAYISAYEQLVTGMGQEMPKRRFHGRRLSRYVSGAVLMLSRYFHEHRESIATLTSRAPRWLGSADIDQLTCLVARLNEEPMGRYRVGMPPLQP